MKYITISTVCLCQILYGEAFAPSQMRSPAAVAMATSSTSLSSEISRRDAVSLASLATFGIITSATGQGQVANASGGATAGGAYLLSAKQRYNARVTAAVKGYLALSASLDADSLEETKAYFTVDEVGCWKDVTAAGYLLANAFRRSSTTPPDSLPSVKKWKAFAAEQENLQKALKKKDVKKVKESYAKSQSLLNEYLELVELPPTAEI